MDPREFLPQAVSEIQEMVWHVWRYACNRPAALAALGVVLIYVAARRKSDLAMGFLGLTALAIFTYLMKLVLSY